MKNENNLFRLRWERERDQQQRDQERDQKRDH